MYSCFGNNFLKAIIKTKMPLSSPLSCPKHYGSDCLGVVSNFFYIEVQNF